MAELARVAKPGLQTTIQDFPGRIGYWRVGIPPSGPMDSYAFRLANLLVGNDAGEPGLEVQFIGPELVFEDDGLVAITGGDCGPTLDDSPVSQWQSFGIAAGQLLKLGAVRTGARSYLAVAGGVAARRILGSCASFPRGGIGEPPLSKGQHLQRVHSPSTRRAIGLRVRRNLIPTYTDGVRVDLTPGPHFDWLDDAGRDTLLSADWKVSGQSDRTGIRLIGPKLSFSTRALTKAPENGSDPTNVINTGYPIGGLNLCGDTPIILPVDGPSQGGFITPFVVASASLWRVGQARPGQVMHFRLVSVAEAIDQRRATEAALSDAVLGEEDQTAAEGGA
jgi:urea carboxylase